MPRDDGRVALLRFRLGDSWAAVAAEDVADIVDGADGRRVLRVDRFGETAWVTVERPVELFEVTPDRLLPLSASMPRRAGVPLMGFVMDERGLVALLDLRRIVKGES